MILKRVPQDFQARFEVVSVFIEAGNQFLLLHRQDEKSEGNKWGVPAGKIEAGESIEEALVREVREEIGLDLAGIPLSYFDTVYVRYPEYDFVYHMYRVPFEKKPNVLLNLAEHKDFSWASPHEALRMHLVQDEDACIKLLYGGSLVQLITQSVARAHTLDDIYAAIVGVFHYLREDLKCFSIGYVSGVVTSDGPEKVEENLERLCAITTQLRKVHIFPLFSPPDIFSKDVLFRVEQTGAQEGDFIQFWRSVLLSGYISDIFMTPRWQESRGATDERQAALQANLNIHYL